MRYILALCLILLISANAWGQQTIDLFFLNGASLKITKINDEGANVVVVTVDGKQQMYRKADVDFSKTIVGTGIMGIIEGAVSQANQNNFDKEKTSDMGNTGVIITEKSLNADSGYWTIDGSVKNTSSASTPYTEIKAKIYSQDGSYISTEHVYSDPVTLQPGQEGSFEIIVQPRPDADPNKIKLIVEHE